MSLEWVIGVRIGSRYELLDRIGQGGMGTVWRARDELLGREIAIKEVLLSPGLDDAEREVRNARMMREARSAARLSHPGVVTVHDVVEAEGRPWIVMELISAPSLQRVIDVEGRLSPDRVAKIGRQLLEALRAAHAAGILHRDVKPANVLLGDADRTVITDFGIAVLEGDVTLTRTGAMVGSPAYTAPERLLGEPAAPAADLWSLGATLYAAVEGRPPFDRSSLAATIAAITTEDVPPARNAGPLAPVLAGLLCKDPADRITAAEAHRRLIAVGAEEPLLPHAVSETASLPPSLAEPAEPAARPGARLGSPAVLITAGVFAGLLAMAVFAALVLRGEPSDGAGVSRTPVPAISPSQGAVPKGWKVRHERDFSVTVPASWIRRTDPGHVYYESPSTLFLLQVSTTSWDADPVTQANAVSKTLAADFRGYREATVTPVTYRGVQAADLRFAYDRSTGPERAQDRFFRIGGRTFALFFRMPAAEWPKSESYLGPIFDTFQPR